VSELENKRNGKRRGFSKPVKYLFWNNLNVSMNVQYCKNILTVCSKAAQYAWRTSAHVPLHAGNLSLMCIEAVKKEFAG
jgi:hypothetical protein